MQSGVRRTLDIGFTALLITVAAVMSTQYLNDRDLTGLDPGTAELVAKGWREWDDKGILMGSRDAPMRIAVFMDFTCPHCRELAAVLNSLQARFSGDLVSIQFLHFPLPGRQGALPMAIAAECAHQQGRFRHMYRFLSNSERKGTLAGADLAAVTGIPEVSRFVDCTQRPIEMFPRIAAGVKLGQRLAINGTPEVWVNGELFLGRTLSAFLHKAEDLGI